MLQGYDERNQNLIVNINGELVHRDRAGVSPFDSSVQNGDAVWEGLRLYDGRVFRLREHLGRLRKSASMLSYEGVPDDGWIVEQLGRTLKANSMHDGVHIRLMLTRGVKYTSGLDPRINTAGCTLIVLAEHKVPVYGRIGGAGVKLITARVKRPPPDVLNQHIHSSNQLTSVLAKIEANAAGVDDALLLDTRGYVAETSATHLFFVVDGEVLTPTTWACPEGITRSAVLGLCTAAGIESRECDIPLATAHNADECFCTGTMGEIAPVGSIDGHGFEPGPVTACISVAFAALTSREGDRLV